MNGLGYTTNDELKSMSQNALLVSDVFKYDITESTRSADMLIKQFGLSADEAYGLIVQGAQNGLDKNGDLLDTINEYSPQFKQMGFSANEMMNMMVNSVDAGAFSVDKAGDAIKEFTIRAKDGSKTSADAFSGLGLSAEDMTKKFASGGQSARDAFAEVIAKLSEIQDPVKQNTIGVGLFGTQWEDLGSKAVLALGNTKGAIDAAKPTMETLNEIKFDSFGSAIEGIKRNFETGIMIPLGEAVLPLLNTFANWMMQTMPIIQQVMTDAMGVITGLFTGTSDEIGTGFMPSLQAMYDWISPYIPQIQEFFSQAFNVVRSVIENLVPPIMMLVSSTFPILKGAIEFIVGKVLPPLTKIFEYIAEELIPKVGSIFEEMAPRIQSVMETIWAIIEPILNDVMDLFNLVFPTVLDIVSNTVATIGDVINGAIQIFQGLIDFIVGVFTGDWELAWSGIVEIFSGIFDGLMGIVRGAMNGVINMVNLAIRSLNSMKFSLPDVMGGGTVGLNVSTIPMLKDGGNVLKRGLALVGEEGPEILELPAGASVTPLNKTGSINVYITGNTLLNDRDADRLGNVLVNRLNRLGVSSI